MGFTLYSLIEAALLCINAVAILNEQRFLSKSKKKFILTVCVIRFLRFQSLVAEVIIIQLVVMLIRINKQPAVASNNNC